MEYLLHNAVLPYLKEHYHLHSLIKALVLHTAAMGESQIDELVGDLEEAANPTVGLLAHPGQVDLRITAKADSVEEADRMIQSMAATIRQRLGDIIYGQDEDTLESAAIQGLASRGWNLSIFEAGMNARLAQRLQSISPRPVKAASSDQPISAAELSELILQFNHGEEELVLGVSLAPGKEKQDIFIAVIKQGKMQELHRSYGGPPDNAPIWAVNLCLNLIREVTSVEGSVK
jgi:nicotinamide-nucleotide amidase